MNSNVREQILAIRETGIANMFDIPAVQRVAFEMDYFELVDFIEVDRKTYVYFILTGKSNESEIAQN